MGDNLQINNRIKHLNLNRCNLQDDNKNSLIHGIKHIKNLILSNNKLTDSSAIILNQNLIVNP